jgi:hypothetical protein
MKRLLLVVPILLLWLPAPMNAQCDQVLFIIIHCQSSGCMGMSEKSSCGPPRTSDWKCVILPPQYCCTTKVIQADDNGDCVDSLQSERKLEKLADNFDMERVHIPTCGGGYRLGAFAATSKSSPGEARQ